MVGSLARALWAMLEQNSTPNIGEGIKLFNERDAVRYKDTCFSWKQPIRSDHMVYSFVRRDIQIKKFFATHRKYDVLRGCQRQQDSHREEHYIFVSTILICKRDTSHRSARAYTARAREIRACCPPLNYFSNQTKGKWRFNKVHEPWFLS